MGVKKHRTLIPVGDSVPMTGPSGHKTGVISDSRLGSLLINDNVIVPQGMSVEVIVLHLQHEASTQYCEKRIFREAHITRSAYYEKRMKEYIIM